MNNTLVLVFVTATFVLGGLLYIYNPAPIEYKEPTPEQVACTADAMLCPDGSYVGRSGPNCEFACPSEASCEREACPTSSTTPIEQNEQ